MTDTAQPVKLILMVTETRSAFDPAPDPQPPWRPSDFIGGRLCLDFINSAWARFQVPTRERFTDIGAVITWARSAGTMDDAQAARLQAAADADPAAAETALVHAIAVREALYRTFSAIAAGRSPVADDLAMINEIMIEAMAQLAVAETTDGFTWRPRSAGDRLDQLLWPVIRSTAQLLTSPAFSRVRECAGERCGWIFLDTSKNRTRRWCDMRTCGNVAKARRHQARQRHNSGDAR